jgi:hypothetical protein
MEADGAYVLGALSPPERSEFESHLNGCAECAAAVRQLAPLPGLLGRVDPAMLDSRQPGSSRLPGLLAAVADSRRGRARAGRWRLGLATAAAAVAAAAGTLAGVAVLDELEPGAGGDPVPAAQDMEPVSAVVPVTAQVRLREMAAGTAVWMRCGYPAHVDYEGGPLVFRLVAVGQDGSREQVGSWRAAPGDKVEMTGITRLAGADLMRLELQDVGGMVLLSYEP